MITITIPGKPIAKARPRFYRRGNFVGTYNSQETEEGRWLLEAKSQIELKELLIGAISLKVRFYMPMPKSFPKKLIHLLKAGFWIPHIKRPDLDNLIKFVKDCLNGVVWKDDSQISKLMGFKIYGIEPRTEITIEAN